MADYPTHKQRLLAFLLAQHGTEQRIWSALSDEQKQTVGQINSWSVKDHIAHVTYWREVYTQRLRAAISNGVVPPPDPDFLETNDAVFEEHRDDKWNAVMNWARQAQEELIKAVEAIDGKLFPNAEKFEWTNQQPLWQHIALGEGYHPGAHLSDILMMISSFEEAERIQLELFEALKALDNSEAWQGTQRYNLACFYALHEFPERAILLLEEGFKMNPSLLEWSKHDSDLDSLRELTAFQALYPQEA
jgi:uncharacterized damage-inducible protein DinB